MTAGDGVDSTRSDRPDTGSPALALSARLDRVPFSRFHLRLLAIGGLGCLFEAMDVAVVAFILPVLKAQWQLGSTQVGLLAAGAAMGGIAGALLAGWLGDRIGRRAVMMWALAVYCVASLGGAAADSWQEFLAWRVIAGVGTFAEAAIVAPFLAEFAGPSFRGRYIGALVSFFSFGFVAAALLGYVIVPLEPQAWRYVLVITALPIIMLLWWRRSLPESPRWLAIKGRVREAEQVVAGIERDFELRAGPLPPPVYAPPALDPASTSAASARLRMLFSRSFAGVMGMALMVWFSMGFAYYAFFNWIPSLLVEKGMTVAGSYTYSLVMYVAQIPGYFSAAALNDLLGRRAVITTYMLLGACAAFGMAMAPSYGWIMVAGSCLSFFMNGVYAGLYAYTPELFPTQVRATAHGLASSLSRIGAVVSPIAVGYLFPRYGFVGVFGMTAGILLAGATAVGVLGISTSKRSLEQITLR